MNKLFALFFLSLFAYQLNAQVELSGVINNYSKVTQIENDSCQNKITVTDASPFDEGQFVVLIQMQGATIDESNSSDFGDILELNNTGFYEINEIVAEVGGVLALKISGQLLMNANIDVSGLGFRGGATQTATNNNCTWLFQQNDYFYDFGNWRGAAKGEGIAPIILDKEFGKGPQANGGGGGNDHNSGGGGGANISSGGAGGENDEPQTFGCQGNHPGLGGKAIGNFENRIFLGGGGGAGHDNNMVATNVWIFNYCKW